MSFKIILAGSITVFSILISGCATVPLESNDVALKAKTFNSPSDGNAGLYVFRDGILGTALKKDIWVDDKCLGESATKVFFFQELKGDQEHKISTESEFSPNDLMLKTENGKNYFVRQYIKMGAFVGGANLEVVNEEEGKKAIVDSSGILCFLSSTVIVAHQTCACIGSFE